MWRSLRFRLPVLFLAGIVLAGLVATAIAFRLYQEFTRDQSITELRREAVGIARLYANQAERASDEGRAAPEFAAANLERATGDRIFYVGTSIFPGQERTGLRKLPVKAFNAVQTSDDARPAWEQVQDGRIVEFDFVPPGLERNHLAVAAPLRIGDVGPAFGAIVVAKPEEALTERLTALLGRLAVAFLGGIVVAGALGWYLSRRIVRPVLAVSKAADEVAAGNYEVDVPDVPGGGEISQLAERFRGMAERLREADELERNFLMTVSHELRTPLTAIRGHVEALREGLVEDEQASLRVVAEEGARLERLVGDVLDLAKLDAHRFTVLHEEVDMGRLVELAYSTFGEEARRRQIEYRQALLDRPVIVTDGDRVLQIISNLLANAFRWTPDGGRVELALSQENGAVSVSVQDSGPGIAPEERDRIFRPFFTRDGGGTGLGLAIARELALALGGRIELVSAPGLGSRFELLLPSSAE